MESDSAFLYQFVRQFHIPAEARAAAAFFVGP
jgi:hypothetical protein